MPLSATAVSLESLRPEVEARDDLERLDGLLDLGFLGQERHELLEVQGC